MRHLYLLITILFAFSQLEAQEVDSLHVNTTLQFTYMKDTVKYVKMIYVDSELNELIESNFPAKGNELYWSGNRKKIATDMLLKNTNLNVLDKKLRTEVKNDSYQEYVFFEADRVAEVNFSRHNDGYKKDYFVTTYAWKLFSFDNIEAIALYETRFDEKFRVSKWVLSLKNGRFCIGEQFCDIYPNDYRGADLLVSRRAMYDTDTIELDGKYGLISRFEREIIPVEYDSLKMEEKLIRAFKDGKEKLLDYQNNLIIEDYKVAYEIPYCYQVMDKDNRMFFLDSYGNKDSSFKYSVMSVDDVLYPLPYDKLILAPDGNRSKFYLADFEYAGWLDDMELENARKVTSFEKDTLQYFGLEKLDWARIGSDKPNYHDYKYHFYEIPDQYDDLKLISNKISFQRSGDYVSLDPYWIIARKGGKYGVFDARNPDKPVLPFIYDNITGISTHLILEQKGLKCYYPLSSEPHYSTLDPFVWRVARFSLPNGQRGWLSKDGKEYMD